MSDRKTSAAIIDETASAEGAGLSPEDVEGIQAWLRDLSRRRLATLVALGVPPLSDPWGTPEP